MRFCKYSKLPIGTNSVRVDIQCSNTMKTIDIQHFCQLLVFPTLIYIFSVVVEGIQILSAVNETIAQEEKPLALVGDPGSDEVKSCWGYGNNQETLWVTTSKYTSNLYVQNVGWFKNNNF